MTDTRELLANIPPFGLRMQADLKERIKEAAEANNRSMNAEIIARLEASFPKMADKVVAGKLTEEEAEELWQWMQERERQSNNVPTKSKSEVKKTKASDLLSNPAILEEIVRQVGEAVAAGKLDPLEGEKLRKNLDDSRKILTFLH